MRKLYWRSNLCNNRLEAQKDLITRLHAKLAFQIAHFRTQFTRQLSSLMRTENQLENGFNAI